MTPGDQNTPWLSSKSYVTNDNHAEHSHHQPVDNTAHGKGDNQKKRKLELASKIELPPMKCSAICAVKLPKFRKCSSISCQLMLHWTERSPEEDCKETSEQLPCGTITLNVEDFINKTYIININSHHISSRLSSG